MEELDQNYEYNMELSQTYTGNRYDSLHTKNG